MLEKMYLAILYGVLIIDILKDERPNLDVSYIGGYLTLFPVRQPLFIYNICVLKGNIYMAPTKSSSLRKSTHIWI